MSSTVDIQVESFDIQRGRLSLVSGPLTMYLAKWTFEQAEAIRMLLADGIECVVHLAVADDGSAMISSIEARTFMPRVNCLGGEA